jgi:putative YhbY family RNA-binding protein
MPDQAPLSTTPPLPFPPLSAAQRCALKARAHHLPPAVMIGQHGLTENVTKAVAAYLNQNDLIKIRILGADHEARLVLAQQLSEQMNAELVQHIGRQLIFYRPLPKKKKTPEQTKSPVRKQRSRTPASTPSTRPKPKASFTHRHRTSKAGK